MFSDNLINLRESKNIKQKDLAKYLNVTPSTYSAYEKNRISPSIDILLKISEYYEVSLDWLLDNNYNKKPEFNKNINEKNNELIANFKKLTEEHQIVLNYIAKKMLKEQNEW